MKTIGITGGVGAGKSSILNFIKDNYNCEIIYADDLAKELCKKGNVCYEPLIKLLSKEALDENLELDKKKMASMIFDDRELRVKVNNIIHPAVKEYILNRIRVLNESNNTDYFFLEAALLIEEGYDKLLDELWYIYADEDVRIKRLYLQRGYSEEKSKSIIKSQLCDELFRSKCAFVIDNSGDIEDSKNAIKERLG